MTQPPEGKTENRRKCQRHARQHYQNDAPVPRDDSKLVEGVPYTRKRRPVRVGRLWVFPESDAPGFRPVKPSVQRVETLHIGRTDHGVIQPAAGRKGKL